MSTNQYTIRSVPDQIDRELRRRAIEEHKSLNSVILEALAHAVGVQSLPTEYNDVDFLIGSWVEDPAFDAAVAGFGEIDKGMWN